MVAAGVTPLGLYLIAVVDFFAVVWIDGVVVNLCLTWG